MPLTKSEKLNRIAEATSLKKKDVSNVLEAYNELLAKTLKKEKKIKVDGLGIFTVRHRKARNPQTGEIVNVKAKTVLKFRVAKVLKDKVL